MIACRVGAPDAAGRAGFDCVGVGFGLGALTTMGGSRWPPDWAAVDAGAFGAGVSPAAGAWGAGVVAAGASLAGDGAVCAKAPAQSDEIRKDVEASNRGRNDTEAPC
jgi:hypothetical protein